MKRFLVLKDRIVVKFNNLDFTGSLDHLGSKDEIVQALSVWVDKEENDENEKELALLLFPEQNALYIKNEKAKESISKLLVDVEDEDEYDDEYDDEDEDENEEDSNYNYEEDEYEEELKYYEDEKERAKNAPKNWAYDTYKNSKFKVVDGSVYMEGIDLSIPDVLVERFAELREARNHEEFAALANFWRWTSLNPDAESRENIYAWVRKHNIPILSSGLILTFRRVVKVDKFSYDFSEFVNKVYMYRRSIKKTTKYNVVKCTVVGNKGKVMEFEETLLQKFPTYCKKIDYTNLNVDALAEFSFYYFDTPNVRHELNNIEGLDIYCNVQGSLYDLYQEKNQEIYYTSNYDNRVKYYVGKEVRMEREDVDSNKENACSKGYHVAGVGFAYSGFGNTPVACVVNPRDILVVYENDFGKCRTSAFTIVGILNEDCEWANDAEMKKTISKVTQDQLIVLENEMRNNPTFSDNIKQVIIENELELVKSQITNFNSFRNMA